MSHVIGRFVSLFLLLGFVMMAYAAAPVEGGKAGAVAAGGQSGQKRPVEAYSRVDVLVKLKPGGESGLRGRLNGVGGADMREARGLRAKTSRANRGGSEAEKKSTDETSARWRVIRLKPGQDPRTVVGRLRNDPAVEQATLNAMWHLLQASPNDPRLSEQWALNNVGQTDGVFDADIDAAEAWTQQDRADGTIVAVIDTGVDYTHEELSQSMWVNAAELNGQDRIDDDNNGCIDDVYGCNTALLMNRLEFDGAVNVDDDQNGCVDDLWIDADSYVDCPAHSGPLPAYAEMHGPGGWLYRQVSGGSPLVRPDTSGHGTLVAGVIAAAQGNTKGIAGLAPGARIISVPALFSYGAMTSLAFSEAIYYAVDQGANIINASVGVIEGSPLAWTEADLAIVRDALAYARARGVLFVAAAGNTGKDIDAVGNRVFPAAFDLDNVIAVAATDHKDALANFSSWGASSVDIAAPGVAIVGPVPVGAPTFIMDMYDPTGYLSSQGTSFAAPYVSGSAALFWAKNPGATYSDVRQAVLASGDPLPALYARTVTGRRLNVSNLLSGKFNSSRALSLGTVSSDAGTTVQIPINFINDRFPQVVGLQFDINYNPGALSLGKGAPGDAVTAGHGLFSFPVSAGTYRVVVSPDAANGALGAGTLATIPITIQAAAANGPGQELLAVSNVVMSDDGARESPPGALVDGLITVANAAQGANTDIDGDGMPDMWEIRHGLDALFAGDASLDSDFDGRSNLQEFRNGTHPMVADAGPTIAVDHQYAYTQTFGTTGNDYDIYGDHAAMAADGAGNIFLAGHFDGTADFNGNGPDSQDPTSRDWDGFVTKYDRNRQHRWTRVFGSGSRDEIYAVAADANGNVFVTGMVLGEVDVDGDGKPDLTGTRGSSPYFLAKLDPDGRFVWARGLSADVGSAGMTLVSVTGEDVFVGGGFSGRIDFNPTGTPDVYEFGNGLGGQAAFVTRYDRLSGGYGWTRVVMPSPTLSPDGQVFPDGGLGVDGSGNVYLSGAYAGTVDFNPLPADTVSGTNNEDLRTTAQKDIFVTKLNRDGSYAWSHTFGDPAGTPRVSGMGVSAGGEVVFTGETLDLTALGSAGPDDPVVTRGTHKQGAFLAKLNAAGTLSWIRSLANVQNDGTTGGVHATFDRLGNIYLAANSGPSDFYPDELSSTPLVNSALGRVFIRFDSDGQFEKAWMVRLDAQFQGISQSSMQLATDPQANFYVAGGFDGHPNFAPDPESDLKQSVGDYDLFVSKYAATGPALPDAVPLAYDQYIEFGTASTSTMSGVLAGSDMGAQTLTYRIISNGQLGSVTITNPATGAFSYTVNGQAVGTDTFTFAVSDGINLSVPATVTVRIFAAEDGDLDGLPDPWELQYFGDTSRDGTGDYDLDGVTDLQEYLDGTHPLIASNGKTIPDHLYQGAGVVGGAAAEYSTKVASDAAGNVYAAGYFRDTVDFNPDPVASAPRTASGSNGYNAAYVTKTLANGQYAWVWSPNLNGNGWAWASSVATAANGDVYVSGGIWGFVDFGNGVNVDLTASTVGYIFLAKLSADGTLLWVNTVGSATGGGEAYDVGVSDDGSVYVTGYFGGTADFDPTAVSDMQTAGRHAYSGTALFLTKYAANGSYGWTRFFAPTNPNAGGGYAYGLVTSGETIYVTGHFYGTMDFDRTAASGDERVNPRSQGYDGFIGAWSSNGTRVRDWMFRGLDDYYSTVRVNDAVVDKLGNVYVTGSFRSSVDFDPSASVEYALNPQQTFYETATFVAKLDGAGALDWALPIHNTFPGLSYSGFGKSLAIAGDRVYVAGSFSGDTDFDPSDASDVRSVRDAYTPFIAAYRLRDGSYVGAWTPVGAYGDFYGPVYINNGGSVYGLATGDGKLHAAGYYVGNLNFNSTGVADVLSSVAGPNGSKSDDAFAMRMALPMWVNSAPVAQGLELSVVAGTEVTGNLIANDADGDVLTYTINTLPTLGTLELLDANTGAYRYTASGGSSGVDSFTFKANDGVAVSEIVTVTVTVTSTNSAPTATDGSVSTTPDTPVDGQLVANDPDGNALTYSIVSGPSKGVLETVLGTGAFTYTPNVGASGTDSFTFKVSDGQLDSNVATVVITITSVGGSARATNGLLALYSFDEGGGTSVRDTSGVGAPLDLTIVDPVTGRTATWSANGLALAGDETTLLSPSLATPNKVVSAAQASNELTIEAWVSAADLTSTLRSIVSIRKSGTEHLAQLWQLGTALKGRLKSSTTAAGAEPPMVTGNSVVAVNTPVHVMLVRTADKTELFVNGVSVQSTAQTGDMSNWTNEPIALGNEENGAKPFLGTLHLVAFYGRALTPAEISQNYEAGELAGSGGGGAPTNTAPTAGADSATTVQNTPVTVVVLGNDTDPDGDTLSVSSVVTPSAQGGSVAINANGTLTYTPASGFSGSDSFGYTISDGKGGTANATVMVTVTASNAVPTAVDDAATTAQNTPVTVVVLGNDTDPDGDTLSVSSVVTPSAQGGSIAINTNGTLTYTPASGFTGSDSFGYTISDGNGGTATATVSITVTAAGGGSGRVGNGLLALYTFDEGGGTSVRDTSGVGAPLDLAIVDPVTGPTATWSTNGLALAGDETTLLSPSLATPNKVVSAAQASGELTIEAWVTASNLTATQRSIVSVRKSGTEHLAQLWQVGATMKGRVKSTATAAGSEPPTVTSGSVVTANTPVHLMLVRTASKTELFLNGVSVQSTNQTGSMSNWTNEPIALGNEENGAKPFVGTLHLVAFYGRALTAEEISQNYSAGALAGTGGGGPENRAPVAVADSASTAQNTPVTVAVLGNDSDADGDSLSVESVDGTTVNGGTVTITAPDSVTYTPAIDFVGTDSFSYTVTDGVGGTASATVTVTVMASNRAPTAVADNVTTVQNTLVTVAVLSNDTDADGDLLSVESVAGTTANGGTVTITAPDSVTYTPAVDFVGTDSFIYTVTDGVGGTASATVSITVTAVGGDSGRVGNGLLALYTFDEGAGASVTDTSGVGTPLNLSISNLNAASWSSNGLMLATTATGESATLLSPDLATPNKVVSAAQVSSELTIEAWVSASNLTATQRSIVSIRKTGTEHLAQLWQNGADLRGRVKSSATAAGAEPPTVNAVGATTANTPVHLMLVRTASKTEIFVNGVLVQSTGQTGSLSNWTNEPIALGNEENGAKPFLGTLHLVAFYGRALTAAEIEQNFNAGALAQ